MSSHVCVCGSTHADEVENIVSKSVFTWTVLSFFIINKNIIKLSTHIQINSVPPGGPFFWTRFAVTIATGGIRKWLCCPPHILASEIRLAPGCSTARWLPLSTPCGNSRALFTVHLSVWHHSEKLVDQFPPVCQLSDLISMATVIQSCKCVFLGRVHGVWHLDKWQHSSQDESLFYLLFMSIHETLLNIQKKLEYFAL